MKKITLLLIIAALAFSCNSKQNTDQSEELSALRTQLDSLQSLKEETPSAAKSQLTTFLTFQNNDAEEAMNFYIGLFDNSKIGDVQKYGTEGPGKEGTIMHATFELDGNQFACSDSPIKHEWDFTPGVSIFVECKSDNEIQTLLAKLSENGQVLMPLDNYGWSTKFAFVEDRFGVSWQLNLQ